MNLHSIIFKTKRSLRSNSPSILVGFGVAGTALTAYLAARGSFEASALIREVEKQEGPVLGAKEKIKAYTPVVWRCYIPAATSGVATIACIVGSTNIQGKRTAAAVSAYSLTEKAFSEYRDKVKDQIGKHQEQVIRDEVARDHVEKNAPRNGEVIVAGSGNVLCCELYTKRYFMSDMETLRKSQNDINQSIVNTLYVSLDDFYDMIGLPQTSTSSDLGWDSDRLMELEFSTVLSEDGRPCLAFNYNYIKPI